MIMCCFVTVALIRTRLSSHTQNVTTKLRLGDTRRDPICYVTKSCDRHNQIPLCIVNIVVVLVDHGEMTLDLITHITSIEQEEIVYEV